MMQQGRENRKVGRRRTLFGGVIYGGDGRSWECKVADISEEGVKAKISDDVELEIGAQVDLKINKFDDLRSCEVMWLRDAQVGLRFLVSIDPQAENMTELFKFVRT